MSTNDEHRDGPSSVEAVDPQSLEHEIEQIAASVHAHVRTVERRLLGLKVKGKVGRRVDAALAIRGLRTHCVRAVAVASPSEPPRAA